MRLSPVAGRWCSVVPPRATMWLLLGLSSATWVIIGIALGVAAWSWRLGLPLAGWAFAAWLLGCIEHRFRMRPIVVVKLLDEGIDVWRPAAAVHVGGDLHRLAPATPCESETWEFQPGELVVCEERRFSEGWALAAVRRAEHPPASGASGS